MYYTYLVSPPSLPSQNQDDIAAKTNAHQPVVYADLSLIKQQPNVKDNKPHPSPVKDDSVVYSDLLIKGQPPPIQYESIELKHQPGSVTVIPPPLVSV